MIRSAAGAPQPALHNAIHASLTPQIRTTCAQTQFTACNLLLVCQSQKRPFDDWSTQLGLIPHYSINNSVTVTNCSWADSNAPALRIHNPFVDPAFFSSQHKALSSRIQQNAAPTPWNASDVTITDCSFRGLSIQKPWDQSTDALGIVVIFAGARCARHAMLRADDDMPWGCCWQRVVSRKPYGITA